MERNETRDWNHEYAATLLEQELGIESEADRLLVAAGFIDFDVLQMAAVLGMQDLHLLFGQERYVQWLELVRFTDQYRGDLTPAFIYNLIEIVQKKTFGITSLRNSHEYGVDRGHRGYTLSEEQRKALEENPYVLIAPISDIPGFERHDGEVIVYPAIASRDDIERFAPLLKPEQRNAIWMGKADRTRLLLACLLANLCSEYSEKLSFAEEENRVNLPRIIDQFHKEFLSIHPLEDLNGMISRALYRWLLKKYRLSTGSLNTDQRELFHENLFMGSWVERDVNLYNHIQSKRRNAKSLQESAAVFLLGVSETKAFFDVVKTHINHPDAQRIDEQNIADMLDWWGKFRDYQSESTVGNRHFRRYQMLGDYLFDNNGKVVTTDEQTEHIERVVTRISEADDEYVVPTHIIEIIGKWDSLDEKDKLAFVFEHYKRREFLFRGGWLPKGFVITDDHILNVFRNFTAISAGYDAQKRAQLSPDSMNSIDPMLVAQSLAEFNRYMLLGNVGLGDDFQIQGGSDRRLHQKLVDHIAWNTGGNSPFVSMTNSLRTAYAYAQGFLGDRQSDNHGGAWKILSNPENYQGIVIKAMEPEMLAYGMSGLGFVTGNEDSEVLLPGAIIPQTIVEIIGYSQCGNNPQNPGADDEISKYNQSLHRYTGIPIFGNPRAMVKPSLVARVKYHQGYRNLFIERYDETGTVISRAEYSTY